MLKNGIQLTNLTLSYQRRPAVHHLSGFFPEGSMTAIMGPNGGGKSTLLRSLAGLHEIDEGTIERSPSLCLKNTAYLTQSLVWDRQFPLNVFELASQALIPELGLWKKPSLEQIQRVNEAIEKVGLTRVKNQNLGSLSLGQFQRALFARVIVQKAQLILLDEPLSGLDEKSCEDLFEIMHHWHRREGKTLIVVLHDRNLTIKHFETTLVLAREIQGWGPSQEVLEPDSWKQFLLKPPVIAKEEECER